MKPDVASRSREDLMSSKRSGNQLGVQKEETHVEERARGLRKNGSSFLEQQKEERQRTTTSRG